MLGMRKATQKASVIQLAPKNAAMTISRASPKTRLTMVAAPTMPAALATWEFSERFVFVIEICLLFDPLQVFQKTFLLADFVCFQKTVDL